MSWQSKVESWAWRPKVKPRDPSCRAKLVDRRPEVEPESWVSGKGGVKELQGTSGADES